MTASPWDLRDEQQVKDYLEKLETEFSFQCFYEKQPDGCHRFADFHELTKKDHVRASAVFKQNCDENKYAHSCHKFANKTLLGQGTAKDSRTAMQYYELGCKHGYFQSCANAGLMHLMGKGVPRADPHAAIELLQQACTGGIRESCYRLSAIYLAGWPLKTEGNTTAVARESSTVEGKRAESAAVAVAEASCASPGAQEVAIAKDMDRALAYSVKSCDMGVYQACHNLSRMYRLGDGVPRDMDAAEKYRKKAQSIHQELTEQMRTITFGGS